MRRKKRNYVPVAIFSLIAVSVLSSGIIFGNKILETSLETPKGPIHWHFTLDIFLDGEKIQIPAGTGIETGNVTDFEVSGMDVSPMHTHDLDNVVHIEQVSPRNDTMTVGYFFKIWNRTFTSECIIDRCSSDGNVVKMFVNGGRSFDFGNHMPKDGDVVEIFYEEEELA